MNVCVLPAAVEVILEDAKIKQHLHVVFLDVKRSVLVGSLAGEIEVLTRFLFHQQLKVGRHQIDTSLDAQLLAYERGFQYGFVFVVSLENLFGNLPNVFDLRFRFLFEFHGIEVTAGSKVECMVAEVRLESVANVVVLVVDDIVEGCSGKISENGVSVVWASLQTVHCVKERMVSIVLEAVGNRGDVEEIIWFDDNYFRHNSFTGNVAVEQIELHPFTQNRAQIGEVDIVGSRRVIHS